MVDTTIKIGLEIDGSQAVREFENVATASDAVLENMKKIRSESGVIMPGSDSFFDQSQASVERSFNRINAINRQIDTTPIFSTHQLSNLYAEREMLRRGIEATVKEMQQFASASVDFIHSFSSKKGGSTALQSVTKMMPSLMNIVRQVADFQRESDTLMDTAAFKAGIKNKIVEAGLTSQLGFAKDSKSMDRLAEYLMLRGTDQTQRKSFMSHIASGFEKKQHLYDSFSDMLPQAFKQFHASKGTIAAPDDTTQITARERRQIAELLKSNQFFMEAAEATGVGRRRNGAIEIRSGITRGMVNRLAGNLYGTIIASAKGMPMYGITDVDDPQYWDRIARKSNKPFLGSMNSARILSDNFDWLKPTTSAVYKDTSATYTPVKDRNTGKPVAVPFSPNIKRYEVANYTLEDLRKNIDLNKDRSKIYGQQTVNGINPYISIDHSARLENIFRHRRSGLMPRNNDAVDDFFFLSLDKRLANPKLDEDTRQKLMDEYASYIDNGITKMINGKATHFSFTRAHKGLGLEFVQDEIFNAMAPIDPKTGERDLSAFWGGVKMPKISVKDKHLDKKGKLVNYTPEEVFNLAAKFVEYASKDATSGESIESLYGTVLPDKLKIGIFDLEDAAKKVTSGQSIAGAGMNGTSYISKRLVPGGFQARMPGIKTALNSIDFGGFLSHFGGAIKTIGPNGRVENITPDLDLLLSMSDIKNAGIRYQDDQGNLLPTKQIIENIRQEIKNNGGQIFANKTMNDAQGGIHWMSRQFSQILGDDPEFVQMTAKAFLDEYERVGTLQGALDTVFAGDSEMRDLILSTHGAIMSDRKIQDRIQDFRTGMISRISQGDTILPRELETSRAMAQPWLFNAVIAGMKKINASGTGAAEAGKQTYYDTVFGKLSKEQQDTLGLITMDNNSVAYQKIMAEVLGIGRYPATSRSARTAENILAGSSKKAQAMRKALEKSGFDPNAFYISPSSPLMTLLQDADFDGDVMDLIGLVYSGQDKNGEKLNVSKVFQRVYERGMEKIDKMGLSQAEAEARKAAFTNPVFKMTSFDARKGKDVMNVSVPSMQSPYYMGSPDAVVRNAMQVPWEEYVVKAMADAESQYSVNSVRHKQGLEMDATPEQKRLLINYRAFTEFFHAVNKNRDEFGNVDIPSLTEAMRSDDGLSGAKFWATNLPFHTMSPNVRGMMLSRYFAKQRGININEGYDWNYIFDSVLGKKDTSTALGRMQSGLRDAWMGYLNADYLAINEETIAELSELRAKAVEEEAAKVKQERNKEGSYAYGKKGSNRSIAEHLVDRLGGNVIKNAAAGMAMSESHMQDGEANKGMFDFLQALHMPNVVGGIDLSQYLAMKTTPQTFEEMSATSKSTQLARVLDMFNLLTSQEKQRRIDNMPRLSFSSLSKFAYHPEEFMRDIVSGREDNASLPATEIGQAAHTAIEHFMRARMSGAFYKADGSVDQEGLAKAQQEALTVFDQYLGVKKAPNGFHREGRGLTDAERAEMLMPGKKLNERYERLKSFIGSKDLFSIFPEKDWEVIGIESSNVGNGEKTAKGNMKIPGKGKKLLSPEQDVEMTGSYDLLFKNRRDGRVVMGDIKNYWQPTNEEFEKWKVQQAIYASQLKKNGFENIGSAIIEPYYNRQRNIGLTNYDLEQSDENVAKAIKAIQGLAKNGDTTIKDVYDAARFVQQTLFGDVKSSVGDQIADRYSKYARGGKHGGASVTPNLITDALWMHDRYNEAVENDEDILKFINKETRSRDSVFTSDMAWRAKFNQAEAIHETAVQHEKSGRTAEAQDLDARYEAAIRALDNNMGIALTNHIVDFADNVRSSIDGQSGTKEIQATVKAYKNTKTQQTGLEESVKFFQDRITKTREREEALGNSIKQLEESDARVEKDESVYDKLIQYTKEALGQTDDTKNISARKAAGKRAARTKLINANAQIRDNAIFTPIQTLLQTGQDEQALELMEQRKKELSNIRKNNKSQIAKQQEEQKKENAQGNLMDAQRITAQNMLNANAPLVDIYLSQLKKSATSSLDDSFIALAGITDKNVGKPFSTSKARTDYINAVGNSLQDASSLLETGMISETEFARYKAQADTLLKENNLFKVEQAAIDEAKSKLGMKHETPSEQREKWLKDRQQVLEAERDLKKREARKESMDAYKQAKKEDPNARFIDYGRPYQETINQIDQQYEAELARTKEERKDLEKQNELARMQRLERLDYQNKSAQEQRDRAYRQQLRNRRGQSRSRFVASYRQQDDMRFSLIKTAEDNEFAAKQERERLDDAKSSFETKYKMSYEDYNKLSKEDKDSIAGDHIKDAQYIAETTKALNKYESAAKDARTQSQQFTPAVMGMSAGFQAVSQTASMFLSRFGRQAFYRILNETKQFVKQYNKTLTEIQMITLKSDDEMSTLGDSLIDKAKELKISVSEISQSAATLYRQGLSDEEVSDRLEVVSKFSKVSGTKVADATKLITVAMNTGLVSDPQIAADIVTALGDNAATNAQQIEKGIEKAGAAAAADGTTFAELASMLTAITSTTQIGGNVAGRTLNTIFGRMNKIGTKELITDENGNQISGSAIAKLLAKQGIDMYENGNKRSSYDVLYDLSKVWENMSDAEQQQIANAIAGTRQYSNFAAIMQGMSEGKVNEYIDMAEGSEGLVDEKYSIYAENLEAALTDLKNTWDSLVHNLTDGGTLQGFIETLSSIVQGVDSLREAIGGVGAVLTTVIPLMAAMTLLRIPGGAIPGLILAGVTLGGLAIAGNAKQAAEESKKYDISPKDRYVNYYDATKKEIDYRQNLINRTKELGSKYNNGTISAKETDELKTSLEQLSIIYENIGSSSDSAVTGLANWSSTCAAAQQQTDEFKTSVAETRKELAELAFEQAEADYYQKIKDIKQEAGLSAENVAALQGIQVTQSNIASPSSQSKIYLASEGSFLSTMREYGLEDADIFKFLLGDELFSEYDTADNERKSQILSQYLENLSVVTDDGYNLSMHTGNTSTTTGALLAILADQGGKNNNFGAAGEVHFTNEQNKDYEAMLGALYPVLPHILGPKSDAMGFISSIIGSADNPEKEFIKAFRSGFSGYNNVPDGLLKTLNLAVAQIISGERDLSSYSGMQEKLSEASKSIINQALESNLDYQELEDEYKTAVAENVNTYFANSNISEYDIPSAAKEYVANEVAKANNLKEKYIATTSAGPVLSTIDDFMSSVQLSPKDLKYANEYASLLRKARSARNIYSLGAMSGTEYQSFIEEGKDAKLLEIWQDLNNNNGQGQYRYSDLLNYLESVVYGSSKEEAKNKLINTAYSLSDMQNNLSAMRETPNGSESLYKIIADTTEIDVNYIRSNYASGVASYKKELEKRQKQYEADVRANIEKDYGIRDMENIPDDIVDLINADYADLGIKVQKSPKQKGLAYSFSGAGNANTYAALRDYSSIFTKQELNNVARKVKNLSWNEAVNRIGSGTWSEDELTALTQQYPDLVKYMKMSAEQKASLEGLNLKRTIETQFVVTGVRELEEAGKVAQGTADAIEKLSKGGKEAIDVSNKMGLDAFTEGQRRARLLNGSDREKAKAAMEYLGIQDESVYYANEAENYQRALATEQASRIQESNKYIQAYSAAMKFGDTVEAQRQIAYAKSAGFELTPYVLPQGARVAKAKDGKEYVYNKYGRRLSDETEKYMQGASATYIGTPKISYSDLLINDRQYTMAETNALAKRLMSSGRSWNEAVNAGVFTAEEFNAIAKNNPDVQKYLTMTKEQQASTEGQALKRSIDIAFDVEGIEELEKAGVVAEGTADSIEKLKKGGKIALDVVLNMQSEVLSSTQTRAKLEKGTVKEQDEAIMAMIPGLTRDELYATPESRERYLQQAKNAEKLDREERIKQMWYEFKKANPLDRGQIRAQARRLGYDINLKGYEETGDVPDIVRDNYFGDIDQLWTASQLAAAQNDIINGRLDAYTSNDQLALFEAAKSKLGEQSLQYLRMRDKGGYSEDELNAQLAKAQAEVDKQAIQAAEEDALKEAELSSLSVGGMQAYGVLKYQQSNKSGLAANRLYEAMSGVKPEGIESIEDLSEVINSGNVDDWKTLLENNDELAKKMSDAGINLTDSGVDLSNLKNGAEGASSAFEMLITAITGASEAYNQQTKVLSAGETYERASEYISGMSVDKKAGFEALSSILGNDNLSNVIRNNIESPEAQAYYAFEQLSDQDKMKYAMQHNGVVPQAPDAFAGLNDLERAYAEQVLQNASLGITGLTDVQKYNGLSQIISGITSGTYSASGLYNTQKIGALKDYLSVTPEAENWFNASQILEGTNVTMANVQELDVDKYKEQADAITELYGGLEQAAEAHENFVDSVANSSATIKNNVKNIDAYNIGLQRNNKNLKTSNDAMIKENQLLTSILAKQKVRTDFAKGKAKASDIAEATGMSEKDAKKKSNKERIQEQLEKQEQEDIQAVESFGAGYLNDINTALTELFESQKVTVDGPQIDISTDTGEVDFSALTEAIGADAAAEMQALAEYLASLGIKTHFNVTKDADGAPQVQLVVDSLGTGGGKGGGGGGGKSEADKLLERQQHEVKPYTHELNMLNTKYTAAIHNGDYDTANSLINEQIDTNNELRELYKTQIEEIKDQMDKETEGSDDWYKLRDALYSAEEALENLDNTIHDLDKQIIDNTLTLKEAKNTRTSHISSMVDSKASYYDLVAQSGMTVDDKGKLKKNAAATNSGFSNWVAAQDASILAIQEEIKQAKKDKKDYETFMKQYDENSPDWIEYRNKAYEEDENIAEKTNELLQKTVEKNNAIVSNIQSQFTHADADTAHKLNMSSEKASYYQNAEAYGKYRTELLNQNKQYKQQVADATKARDMLLKEMEVLPKYSDAWYAARDAVYSFDEQILEGTVHIEENKRAIDASKIEELANAYDENRADYQHVANMYDSRIEMAKFVDDDVTARNLTIQKTNKLREELASAKSDLNQLEKLAKSKKDKITDESAWDTLRDKIKSAREEVQKYSEELIKSAAEINRITFEELKENYSNQDALYQHETNMLRYSQTLYKNRGEYTIYGQTLKAEQSLLEGRLEDAQQYKAKLLKLREEIKKTNLETTDGTSIVQGGSSGLKSEIGELSDALSVGDLIGIDGEYEVLDEAANINDLLGDGVNKLSQLTDVDTYEAVDQELMKIEETERQIQVEADKIKDAIDENNEKIRQVRITVENALDKEIRARIKKQRDQLSAEVSLQTEILNVIKDRYNKEWDIIKKDIDKKKEALNKEKALINERLQARRKAEQTSDKEEELAEYKKQYAIISADASRTKDAKELLRKIEDLEEELSWQTAEDIAAYQTEAIDDQIEALDKYVAQKSQDLADKLKDNNNLINDERFIKAFSGEDSSNYIEMMKENNDDYKYATAESRKKMEQAWDDTWKAMKDILDTYWDSEDFVKAMKDEKSFVEFMKQSDDYRLASDETGRASKEYQYREMYKALTRAEAKTSGVELADDSTHQILDGMMSMKNWTYTIGLDQDTKAFIDETVGKVLSDEELNKLNTGFNETDATITAKEIYTDAINIADAIDSNRYIELPVKTKPKKADDTDSSSDSSGGSYHAKYSAAYYNPDNPEAGYGYTVGEGAGDTQEKANANAIYWAKSKIPSGYKYESTKSSFLTYAKGGLVDYTGPAWVDGTKTHPEAFLSAYDTETIRSMLDAMNYIRVNPGIVPDLSAYGSSNTVGDIHITINQAELKSDADFDEVARIVGQKFTKELSKSGFNVAGYAF